MTDQVTNSAALPSKELQQLAREYAVYLAKDFPEANCLRNEAINLNEEYVADFLRWLSSRYCIVEKKVIRKEYEKAKSTHGFYTSATCINEMESRAIDHSQGRMYELSTLFGKELFNEEK